MGLIEKYIQGHIKDVFRYFESTILKADLKCDEYLDSATPRQKYVFDILLKVPIHFIIHQWLLLCTYSNYWLLEILLFVVRYGVCLLLAGIVNYNTGVHLHVYIILTFDITAVWLINIKYWTHQDAAYEISHGKDVFVWSDITENWWIPVIVSIVLQNIHLSLRLWYKLHRVKENFGTWIYAVPFVPLFPDILSVCGVFPAFMSELSYWLSTILLIALCSHEVLIASMELEGDINRWKLDVLRTKAKLVYDAQRKLKYQSQIEIIEQRISANRNIMYVGRVQAKWLVRDTSIAFGIPYIAMAVVGEILIYQRSIYSLFTLNSILEITTSWCTSPIIAMFLMYACSLVSNLLVALCVYMLTTEINLVEALDAKTGTLVQTTSLIAFIETNFLSLYNIEKQNAMKKVMLFSIYTLFIQTIESMRRKVLNVVNSGSQQSITFHVRFWILTIFLTTAPTFLTYFVATHLKLELLVLFFASGNCILLVNTFYMLVEYSVATLTWHTTDYLNALDSILSYLNMSRGFMLFAMIALQCYYRYMFPLFNSSWTLRFCLEVFFVVSVAYYIGTTELKSYRHRNQTFTLLNNLPDVRFSEEENDEDKTRECSICLAEIIKGKALPCAHAFHRDCLQRWFQVKLVCPFCNTVISFDKQTEQVTTDT